MARLVGLILFLCCGVASAADLTWVRSAGGSGSETAFGVAVDGSGNVLSVGDFTGTVDFDPGAGTANLTATGASAVYVQKLDPDGDLLWAAMLDGPTGPTARDVAVDSGGNVYVVGKFSATVDFDPGPGVANLTSAGLSDAYLVKLDASGGFVWAVKWGGSSNDACDSVATASDGAVYVGGNFLNTVDFDPGAGTANLTAVFSVDAYVTKFTNAGAFVWVRQFGSFGVDVTKRLATDADGDPVILGDFQGAIDFDPGPGVVTLTPAGDFDVFVCKLDANGSFVWARHVGGFTTDLSTGLALDAADRVHVSGYFGGTADFDPGPDVVNFTSAGSGDVFVVALDAGGDYRWAHGIGGTGFDLGLAVTEVSDGRVFVGGRFEETVDFDPGAGTDNRTATGNQPEAFVTEFDSLGGYVGTAVFVGSAYEEVVDLVADAADSVIGTGRFSGTPDFDPGAGFAFVASQGSTDAFVVKLGAAGTPVPDLEAIELGSTAAREAGTAPTFYVFDAFVSGDAGLLDVTLTPPGRPSVVLAFDSFEGGFFFESGVYSSLAALRNDFPLGTYRFDFNGGTTFVLLDYSESEPQCFADVVYPCPGCLTSLSPVFIWDLAAGCSAGATDVGLADAANDDEIFDLSFVPATAGSFDYPNGPVIPTPVDPPPPLSPLSDGETYLLGVDLVDGSFTIEFLNGDAFEYSTSFRTDFDVRFTASGVGSVLNLTADPTDWIWSDAPPSSSLFDIVQGELGTLLDGGGFAAATTSCFEDNYAGTSAPLGPDPPPATGRWYLIRDATGASNGSYSSGGPGESPGRDAGIAASGSDCD